MDLFVYRRLSAALLLVALALAACEQPARPTISLYRAVHIGDLDQVKRHLYWKTDINQADVEGDFPLHLAARMGGVPIARELVIHGADPLTLDAAGNTPLEVALAHGKTQVAQMLLEQGVPLDPQAMLVKLVRAGISDRDTFGFLMRRGANVNLADAGGKTPLHVAIESGHLATIPRFLAHGADVNQLDGQGRWPLELARSLDKDPDRRAIIQLLERYGARAGANRSTKSQGKQE
jgi:uncharacterized protein